MTLLLGKGRSHAPPLSPPSPSSPLLRWPSLRAAAAGTAPGARRHAAHRQPGHRPADRRHADRPRLRRRAADRHQHRHTLHFPSDYALAIADSPSHDEHVVDALRADPLGLPLAVGPAHQPVADGQADRRDRALSAYFSHPGMTSTSAFALAGGGTTDRRRPAAPARGTPPTTPRPIGKSGTALRTALHDIIDNHTKLSYDAVWTALKDTDQDPNNTANVIELYTGRSISKSSNGGSTGNWNREHVWAQSRGGFTTSAGPGTDLHHIRPRTSPSTASAATRTSTTAAPRSPAAPTAGPTPTPSSRATRSRATWRGCSLHGDPLRGRRRLQQPRDQPTVGTSVHADRRPRDAAGLERRRPGQHLRDAAQRPHPRPVAGQPQPLHRPPGVGRGDRN